MDCTASRFGGEGSDGTPSCLYSSPFLKFFMLAFQFRYVNLCLRFLFPGHRIWAMREKLTKLRLTLRGKTSRRWAFVLSEASQWRPQALWSSTWRR